MLAEPLKSLGKKGKKLKIARNSLKRKKARKSKTARKRRLGKTLQRALRSACFPMEKRQENGVQTMKNYGGSRILRIRAPLYF